MVHQRETNFPRIYPYLYAGADLFHAKESYLSQVPLVLESITRLHGLVPSSPTVSEYLATNPNLGDLHTSGYSAAATPRSSDAGVQ